MTATRKRPQEVPVGRGRKAKAARRAVFREKSMDTLREMLTDAGIEANDVDHKSELVGICMHAWRGAYSTLFHTHANFCFHTG